MLDQGGRDNDKQRKSFTVQSIVNTNFAKSSSSIKHLKELNLIAKRKKARQKCRSAGAQERRSAGAPLLPRESTCADMVPPMP